MSIPNLLTILRMALVPALVACIAYRQYRWALFLFVCAGFTDALDGFIARHFNQHTALGAILDPLADKFLLISAFLSLTLRPGGLAVPVWLAVVVVARDVMLLIVSGALWMHGRREFEVSWLGKITTATQILFIAVVLLGNAGVAPGALFVFLVALTCCTSVLSGLDYLWRGLLSPGANARDAGPAAP